MAQLRQTEKQHPFSAAALSSGGPWGLGRAVQQASHESKVKQAAFGTSKAYADDETALVDAACAGDAGVVERILLAGVDADALAPAGKYGAGGEPVLHIAAAEGRVEVVRRLAKLGATVDLPGEANRTALHAAAIHNQTRVCAYLISNGAEVDRADDAGRTPLHYAARQGARPLCRYLIDKGADPHLRDADGLSAVDLMNSSHLSQEVAHNVGGVLLSDCQLRRLFAKYDRDGSGTLDLDEFVELWGELDPMGVPLPKNRRAVPTVLRDIVATAAARGDGRLTYDEFARAALRLAAR